MKRSIAKRFHGAKYLPRSLMVMRGIAIAGIAIGVATLLVAISMISGFQREYRRSILDFNAHVVILKASEIEDESEAMNAIEKLRETPEEMQFADRYKWLSPILNGVLSLYHGAKDFHDDIAYRFELNPIFTQFWERLDPSRLPQIVPEKVRDFLRKMSSIKHKGVVGVTPFLYREGLVIHNGIIKGVVVKGIDPRTIREVNRMKMQFVKVTTIEEALIHDERLPHIILGKALAERLGITDATKEVTKINLMAPKTHPEKQFVSVLVSGIFESGLYDYDSQFALMSIDDTRRIFDTGPVKATGIEIKLNDPQKADAVAEALDDRLMAPYQALTWSELNRDLFEALSLEKLVFSVIMGILVIVAAFNIIGVLVLLISYRTREVAILKALGMKTKTLRKIFTRGGITTGLWGTLIGLAIGNALAFTLKHYQLIHLEPEIYFLETLPIDISWMICGMISLFSIVMCWITSRMAAKRLAQIEISEALKL
jgi:lipoprotein-releasing system permease protein